MALPASPPINLSDIQAEVGLDAGASLIDCLEESFLEDKSLPVNMTRFLGYAHITIPDDPTGVEATLGHTIPSFTPFVVITWDEPSSDPTKKPDLYRLERSENEGEFEFLSTVAGNVYEYIDFMVEIRSEYIYRVRAENAAGNSNYVPSNSVVVDTVPAAPESVSAIDFGGNRARVSWDPGTGGGIPDSFRIETEVNESGLYVFLDNVNAGEGDSYTTGPLAPGNYRFRVAAENEFGRSDFTYSNIVPVV